MRPAVLAILLLISLFGCGRSADEIQHAPLRPTPSPGPRLRDSAISCPDNMEPVFVRDNEICIKKAEVLAVPGFSQDAFLSVPKEQKCIELENFVRAFVQHYLKASALSETYCEITWPGSDERFVSFVLKWGQGRQSEFRFSVESHEGKSSLWACGSQSSSSVCGEPVFMNSVPSVIAELFPEPETNITALFSSLASYVGVK